MISGLSHVCELWLGVSKGMLPVKHLSQRIVKIMAVNYCGRQVGRMLGRAASAYHKKDGATPHHGVCKFSLQYDGRPDERFGMWNQIVLVERGRSLWRTGKEDD